MNIGLKYTIVKTRAGWIGVLGSAKGLHQIILPQHSAEVVRRLLGDSLRNATLCSHTFEDLIRRLESYFDGTKVAFPDEFALKGTTFQREVWRKTCLIPYGETRSYSWVAEQIHKPRAVRAVGQALSKNPLPIVIPCHRVVANNGALRGFRGGLEMKKRLLSLEASTK